MDREPNRGWRSFRLALDRAARSRLRIHDVTGRVMETVIDDVLGAGGHQLRWSAKGVPAGLYFAKMHVNDRSLVRRLVIER